MKIEDRLCRHFRALGVKPQASARFASILTNWQRDNGVEWVVTKLKSLTHALKLSQIKGHYVVPEGWATRRNHNGDKIVRDGLVHRLLSASNQRNLSRALQVFSCYKIFKVTKLSNHEDPKERIPLLTSKQKLKFDTAVMGSSTADSDFLAKECHSISRRKFSTLNKLTLYEKLAKKNLITHQFVPLTHYPKSEKRSPVLKYDFDVDNDKLSVTKIYSESRKVTKVKRVDLLTHDLEWFKLWEKYPEDVSFCVTGDRTQLIPVSETPVMSDLAQGSYLGTIGYIQEGGCKLRAVASPLLIVQSLAEQLKIKTRVILDCIPEDFSGNHDLAREVVLEKLQNGITCYAYDASSFTDRLPYVLQEAVLKSLLLDGFISDFDLDVFKLASRGKYYDSTYNRDVSWKVGQPQGLGPSFNVAALTHYTIIKRIEKKVLRRQKQEGINFCVIGDDVNIFNRDIAIQYESFMNSIGVSINKEKSLISDNVSELCGKVITPDGIIPSIVLKSKMVNSDQAISHLQFYGSMYWSELTVPEQNRALKAVLPTSVGGIWFKIPDEGNKVSKPTINFNAIRRTKLLAEYRDILGDVTNTTSRRYAQWISDSRKEIVSCLGSAPYSSFRNALEEDLPDISDLSGFLRPKSVVQTDGELIHQRVNGDLSPNRLSSNVLSNLDILSMIESSIIHDFYQGLDVKNKITFKQSGKFTSVVNNDFQKIVLTAGLPLDYILQYDSNGYVNERFIERVKTQLSDHVYGQQTQLDNERTEIENNNSKPTKSKNSGWKRLLR